jgi:hypothetical protein
MNTVQIPKQLMEINKMTVDSTLNAILAMQDQSRRITSGIVEKAAWLPEAGKKAINDWMASYKKSVEGLKSASDESYKIMSHLFDKGEEPTNKAQKNAE